jgi:hypothetical protein
MCARYRSDSQRVLEMSAGKTQFHDVGGAHLDLPIVGSNISVITQME